MNQVVGVPSVKEAEVVAKAKRRGFTAEYKQRILNEVDQAIASDHDGEVGAILRREGLYSSHLAAWRKLREAGEHVDGEGAAQQFGPGHTVT
jgi:transposase